LRREIRMALKGYLGSNNLPVQTQKTKTVMILD